MGLLDKWTYNTLNRFPSRLNTTCLNLNENPIDYLKAQSNFRVSLSLANLSVLFNIWASITLLSVVVFIFEIIGFFLISFNHKSSVAIQN